MVQRQEIVDEEKRTRIEALRRSGQIIESRKSHDIPFGIRAIQSGIQVDGIWISNGNSPVPSELKLDQMQGDSDTTEGGDSRARVKAPEVPQQPSRPNSRQGRPLTRTLSSGMPPLERSPDPTSSERPGSAGNRTSYKPRKSSHLRYGSYGETRYDAETLGHLEGQPSPSLSPKTSPKKKLLQTYRLRGSHQIEHETDSSAADNEHSSGTSSDSDATLSNNVLLKDRRHESAVVQPSNPNFSAPIDTNVPSNRATRSSYPVQSSKAEYFSVPRDSPGYESSDPFATPRQSPMDRSPLIRPMIPDTEPSISLGEDSRLLRQSQNRPPSPFVPGELHLNKVVRKVNSGFEVLPAGTFGVPANIGGNGSEVDEYGNSNDDTGDRKQSKLQKKRPGSTTPRRQSSTMERP